MSSRTPTDPVAGARQCVQRALDDDPHRRPEAGHLRVPRRRHLTYLEAAKTAGEQNTLGTNWRSDRALVDSLQTVLRGAATGPSRDCGGRHRGPPPGSPAGRGAAQRAVPVARRQRPTGLHDTDNVPIDVLRGHIAADLAADIGALLASGATFDGEPVQARDIAVIVEQHKMPAPASMRCPPRVFRRSTPVTPTCSTPRPPGLAVPAGGVRPTAPQRAGPRRRCTMFSAKPRKPLPPKVMR